MPGIAGVFGSLDPKLAGCRVDAMVRAMAHERDYVIGTIAEPVLGICAGWAVHPDSYSDCMPVWNERRDICLLFVGEEFSSTDASVAGKSYAISRTHSARDLIGRYEAFGGEFPQSLNGWFSGLVLDLRQRKAILFNDRFGHARVHVVERPDGIYFATEAKSILRLFPDLRVLDDTALAEFVSLGCTLRNRTIFRGVGILPAGSQWILPANGPVIRGEYSSTPSWSTEEPLPESQFADELTATFAALLAPYLSDGRKMAMSLTGGLDGRMIMAWAHLAPGTLPCYTFAGEYRECHDVTIARQVAALCGQRHVTLRVGDEFIRQFSELARQCVYISDGTMDVTGAVELYANRLARQVAPIRLTGNYGSEIVRGNVVFAPSRPVGGLFSSDLLLLLEQAERTYAEERACSDAEFVATKQVPWYHHARFAIEHSQLTPRSPYLDNNLVRLMFRAPATLRRARGPSLGVIAAGNQALAGIPTDRGRMRDSWSALDAVRSAIREVGFKAEYAYDYGMPQWLARLDLTLKPLRPERLFLGRHKFYHFRVWYRDRLRDYVRDVLLDPRTLRRPYFDGQAVEKAVEEHISGTRNHTIALHQALSVELIARTLIEGDYAGNADNQRR